MTVVLGNEKKIRKTKNKIKSQILSNILYTKNSLDYRICIFKKKTQPKKTK